MVFFLRSRLRSAFLLLFLFSSICGLSQVGSLPLNETMEQLFWDSIYSNPRQHTNIRPFRIDEVHGYKFSIENQRLPFDLRINHVLMNKEWFELRTPHNPIRIRPIIGTELGPIYTQAFDYKNDRKQTVQEVQLGLQLNTDITSHLSVSGSFFFTSWTAPVYLQSWIDSTEVIPHLARYNNGDKYGYAAIDFRGEVSYSPNSYFNFQVGRGKHFFGDGYRSLFLSDNAPAYNYLKGSLAYGRLKYVYLLAAHKDINTYTQNQKYSNKFTATHYLSFNATKWLNVALFETIVQQETDSVGYRGLDVNYLNPVIFFRPAEFNIGSPDNALLGISSRLRFSKSYQLYGQFILDEFILAEITNSRRWWGNKYGYQLGAKIISPWRFKGLFLQAEYNVVRPYVYSHDNGAEIYGNLHTPLAHPLGANFKELVLRARYSRGRLHFTYTYNHAQKGLDTEGMNFGGDIYKNYDTRTVPDNTRVLVPGWGENDYGHHLLQGLTTTYRYSEYKIQYILNLNLGLTLEAGMVVNKQSNELWTRDYFYGFFGIRTLLFSNSLDYQ